MKNQLFSLTIAATIIFAAGAFQIANAASQQQGNPVCNRAPGDFFGADGRCHPASEKGKVAPAGASQGAKVDQPAQTGSQEPVEQADQERRDPPVYDALQDPHFREFAEDCHMHHGKVYSRDDWRRISGDANFPDMFHCHREAGRFHVDPPRSLGGIQPDAHGPKENRQSYDSEERPAHQWDVKFDKI